MNNLEFYFFKEIILINCFTNQSQSKANELFIIF
jgi:hypothetical protein